MVDAFDDSITTSIVYLHTADDGIVADGDIGAFLHMAVLATAKHLANHIGVVLNHDNGSVGKREKLEFGTGQATA